MDKIKFTKEVKKEVKKQNFYLSIIEGIKAGLSPADISKKYNISKQNLNYYIRNLKKEGILYKKAMEFGK